MGLFKKKAPGPKLIKSLTFTNSKGFKSFKRLHVVSHGILDDPKVMPELDGKEVRIDLLWSGSGDPFCDVFLDGERVGCLFNEDIVPINEQNIDKVHLDYDCRPGAGGSSYHPRLFIHIAE